MAVIERNGRYRVVYRDADGRQQTAGTFATKKEANAAYKIATADVLRTGRAHQPRPPVIVYPVRSRGGKTVAAYAEEWFPAHNLKPHPRRVYGLILRKHVLRPWAARRWQKSVLRTSAPGSGAWRPGGEPGADACRQERRIGDVPDRCRRWPAPGESRARIKVRSAPQARRKALTPDQFKAILGAVPEHYRLMLLTMVSTGLRWEELTALRATDLEGQVINVRYVMQELWAPHRFELRDGTKNGKARRVKVTKERAADLAALGKGYSFLRPDGGHISQPNFHRDVWQPALAAAGVEGITVRDLRRTPCHLAQAGWRVTRGGP